MSQVHGSTMPITRHYLGWDSPALPGAVAYLSEQLGRGGTGARPGYDLGHVVAVLPAQRAGRRLLELLVQAAQEAGQSLVPPQIVTTGKLPELLYEPMGRVAGELEEHLAWVSAMRSMSAEDLHDLLPNPPQPDDLPGWWSQAKQVRQLRDDLAGHRMRFADVPRLCADRGIFFRGEPRWRVLDAIERAFQETLKQLGITDKQSERLNAINHKQCRCDDTTRIVLIAAPDLNDATAEMLRQVGDSVTSLIMAPQEHAEGFDELGVLRSTYWLNQQVALDDGRLCFVEHSRHQAEAVLATIREANRAYQSKDESLGADQITVGLGDENFAGPARRRLDLAGVPCRQAAGTPASRSRPALLLRALGRFKSEHRLDALAELLRHPDLADYLQKQGDADTHDDIGDWLTLLDKYATDHLQGRLADEWLGKEDRKKRLKALHQRVEALLPQHPKQRLPLPQWSEPIAEVLRRVYADTALREHVADEHQLALALEQVASLLAGQAELDAQSPTCPQVTASQAIALTLSRLAEQVIADEHDGPAVEMLGYLELPLDDAPVLAITGLNEGLIPSSRTEDALLPDALRHGLSMRDNDHRLARDRMLLCAIIRSRPTVKLIAARRSDDDDPLKPSRLLLSCDDEALTRRVRAFFDEDPAPAAPSLPIKPGGVNRFLIHRSTLRPRKIDELSVTAFKDYIACPYRFYLRHYLKLTSLDDQQVEMDPLAFGSVTHDVLQAFGSSDLRDETQAQNIARFLDTALDEQIEKRFGQDRRPAVRIQTEQLRQRLEIFADRQAELAHAGWKIVHVEKKLEPTITVDGEPFKIKGKIDRIDRHDTHGYRVYDYKTGDTGKSPEQTHRTGPRDSREWVDLQLPLYRDLCNELKLTGPIELGYFNLPKKLKEVGPSPAKWDDEDLADAAAKRDQIIRNLRAYNFWPPADPPRWPDGLQRLCADGVMQRALLIGQSDAGGEG